MTDKIIVSWDQLQTLTEDLYHQIDSDEQFVADIVVGISRGGLVPATILSHMLKCPMVPLVWSTRDHINRDYKTAEKIRDQAGSDIVIVDDICDSGMTFETLSEFLDSEVYPHRVIKYAALHYRYTSNFNCLYGQKVDDDRWVVYPYEIDKPSKL